MKCTKYKQRNIHPPPISLTHASNARSTTSNQHARHYVNLERKNVSENQHCPRDHYMWYHYSTYSLLTSFSNRNILFHRVKVLYLRACMMVFVLNEQNTEVICLSPSKAPALHFPRLVAETSVGTSCTTMHTHYLK